MGLYWLVLWMVWFIGLTSLGVLCLICFVVFGYCGFVCGVLLALRAACGLVFVDWLWVANSIVFWVFSNLCLWYCYVGVCWFSVVEVVLSVVY